MKNKRIFIGLGIFTAGALYFVYRYQIKEKVRQIKASMNEEKIQFEDKLTPEFVKKVKEIAVKIGVNASWLTSVMHWETIGTFRPDIQNPTTLATGLIQFMPDTAISLGTTTEKLKKMSAVKQLDYVYMYFDKAKHLKRDNFTNFYLNVFYPVAVNKPYSFIFPKNVYLANPVFRKKGKGYIDKKDIEDALKKMYPLAYK